MNLRMQIAAGLSLVVGVFAITGWLNVAAVKGQGPLLQDIAVRADVVSAHNIELVRAMKDMERHVVQVQQFLSDVSATRGEDGLDDGFYEAEKSAKAFRASSKIAHEKAGALGLSETIKALDQVDAAFDPYFSMGNRMANAYVEKGTKAGNNIMGDFDQEAKNLHMRLNQAAELVAVETEKTLTALAQSAHEIGDANAQVQATMTLAGVLGVLLAVGIGVALSLRMSRLFSNLGRDVGVVLAEQHDQPLILNADRTDEFGPIAQALAQFRVNALDLLDLQKQQAHAAEQAEESRRESLRGMADTVEVETASAVENVATETDTMRVLASSMAQSAQMVGVDSQGVAAAAEQALCNAQAVASAAEQLSASIREIGTQASLSTQVVGNVVESTRETAETVTNLTEAMARIGDVAKLIGAIADQTNLLSLNATIEAARAGEAGKGFAVVAGEVKSLATQTARSTEEISREVLELQNIGRRVASAINGITKAIDDVSAIANSIAAAVEEQDAATQEIVRNVVQTSGAAEEVSRRIAQVADEAARTGEHASNVQSQLDSIGIRIRDLKSSLNAVVRTAAPEVDRRRNPRIAVGATAEVEIGGSSIAVRLADLSLCGGRMLEAPELPGGRDGVIRIPGLSGSLHFSVVESRHGMMRVRFDDSSPEASRLAAYIAEQHRENRRSSGHAA